MKTFLAVALYTALVVALDLGGAVWQNFQAAHAAKVTVIAPAPAVLKTGSAIRVARTIPSDT